MESISVYYCMVRGWYKLVHDENQRCKQRSSISFWVTPSISTTFRRLVKPITMRTRERGTPASSAKNRTHSSFALPSTGGAAPRCLRAAPILPPLVGRISRGYTHSDGCAHPPWPSRSARAAAVTEAAAHAPLRLIARLLAFQHQSDVAVDHVVRRALGFDAPVKQQDGAVG